MVSKIHFNDTKMQKDSSGERLDIYIETKVKHILIKNMKVKSAVNMYLMLVFQNVKKKYPVSICF